MRHVLAASLVLLPGLLARASAHAQSRTAEAPREVPVWEPWELTLTGPPAAPEVNPFTDVVVRARVTPPGGRAVAVEGFCDAADGSVHRVRFMPERPGRHRYEVLVQAAGGTQRVSGDFVAIPSGQRGVVRVDPEHPFHFIWAGTGEHYFWNGTTAYLMLGFTDDADIRASLDRLAALSVNRVRLTLHARLAPGVWGKGDVVPGPRFTLSFSPWPAARPDDVANPGFDVTRFDVRHWQKVDRLVAHARRLGVVVSLIFYLDGYREGVDPFGRAGMGGPDEERYYRYAVARLAAHANVMWDLANEYRLFRDDAWAEKMGALVRRTDPHGHLVSVHGHASFRFRTSPWAGFAMYQQWDDCGGYQFMRLNRQVQELLGRPLPQVNEEYGYEGLYPGFGCGEGGKRVVAPGRDADNRRRIAWEIAMAGGYQTAGERTDRRTGLPPDRGGGWLNGRGDDEMKLFEGYRPMVQFFTRMPWWRLEPHEELAGPGSKQVLAEPGVRYVVRLPAGGRAQVRLSPGRYRASFYDPRAGADHPLGVAEGPLYTSPPAPDEEDWVLLIERDGPQPGPAAKRHPARSGTVAP